MARKPLETTTLDNTELNQENANQLHATAAALVNAQNEEMALVNQLLGQAQMADSFAKFSVTVTTTKLAHVKENKLYRALAGQQSGNGYQLSGTWDEFCNLLGMSREKADLDISNLKAFGEEALESMGRMGIGYRQMRQFRRLPEDSQAALIEVAKAGDKESFVELAEEIISKHSKEKEQLQKERDEAQADYEAQTQLLSQKNQELDTTKHQLEKAKQAVKTRTPNQQLTAIKSQAAGEVATITSLLINKLEPYFAALANFEAEHQQSQRTAMAALVFDLQQQLNQLRATYQLPEVVEQEEDYLSEEAQAAALAAVEAAKKLNNHDLPLEG